MQRAAPEPAPEAHRTSDEGKMWMCTVSLSIVEYWQIPRCTKAERTPNKVYRAR